jgi:hypothetical protein
MLRNKSLWLIRALPKIMGGGKYLVFFLAVFLLLAAPPVAATTWDVATDFPGAVYPNTASNPNGDWYYGWESYISPTPGLNFTAFNTFGYDPNYNSSPYWKTIYPPPDSPGPDRGSVWKNLTTNVQFGVKPGEFSLSVGPGAVCEVVRWISPIAGTVTIQGTFGAGDDYAESYFIAKDNSVTWVWSKLNTYEDGTFDLKETVAVGTTIDFIVGQNNLYGNTPLAATINTVPIPGAVWLLGSGLLGLAGLRRKFRK